MIVGEGNGTFQTCDSRDELGLCRSGVMLTRWYGFFVMSKVNGISDRVIVPFTHSAVHAEGRLRYCQITQEALCQTWE